MFFLRLEHRLNWCADCLAVAPGAHAHLGGRRPQQAPGSYGIAVGCFDTGYCPRGTACPYLLESQRRWVTHLVVIADGGSTRGVHQAVGQLGVALLRRPAVDETVQDTGVLTEQVPGVEVLNLSSQLVYVCITLG